MESPALNRLKPTSTIQEILSANNRTEGLLQSIGISTELNLDKTLLKICVEKKWNENELLTWLRKQASRYDEKIETETIDFSNLNRKQLIKYCEQIKNRLTQQIYEIESDFYRVCKVHGIQYPIIKEMHWHLEKISEKVRFILMLTDITIKPLLKSSHNGSDSILYGEAKKFNRSVKLIIQDQHQVAGHIQKIKKINTNPDNIEGACGTLKTVFQDMYELFSEIETYFDLLISGVIPNLNEAINKD